jgi:hypothetical protein
VERLQAKPSDRNLCGIHSGSRIRKADADQDIRSIVFHNNTMITQEIPSQVEQGAQEHKGQVALLNSCAGQSSTHELLDEAERKLKEAIALLEKAQDSIKKQGVKLGWVETYPKNGKPHYNHGSSEGGRKIRKYLSRDKAASTRREIRNGHRLEQKTVDLIEFTRSLKEGVV